MYQIPSMSPSPLVLTPHNFKQLDLCRQHNKSNSSGKGDIWVLKKYVCVSIIFGFQVEMSE